MHLCVLFMCRKSEKLFNEVTIDKFLNKQTAFSDISYYSDCVKGVKREDLFLGKKGQ